MSKEVGESHVDNFSRLPDAVIHEILHYVSKKNVEDAGRTCILSKRWNHLWFTSPYICYNWKPSYVAYINKTKQKNNEMNYNKLKFLDLLESSIQPRLEKNTSIISFNVHVEFPDLEMLTPRLNRWLAMAIVKKVRTLSFSVSTLRPDTYRDFKIPCSLPQVVLISKTLIELVLFHCKIQSNLDIKLPLLTKLSFCRVHGLDEVIFQKIITGCPLIEFMCFLHCHELNCVSASMPHLKNITFFTCRNLKGVEIKAPNLHEFTYIRPSYRSSDECNLDLAACTTLKVLKLSFALLSFGNLLSYLPDVEILDLRSCRSFDHVKIQIRDLKELVLKNCINFSVVGTDHAKPPYLAKPLISCITACHLTQVHLIFPIEYRRLVWCSELKSSPIKFSHTLKLAMLNPHWYTIVHDNLSEVSLISLMEKEDLLRGYFVCVSSKTCHDMVGDLLLENFSTTLAVITCSSKPIELICKKTLDIYAHSQLELLPFRKHWRDAFISFEISTSKSLGEYSMHEYSELFLKSHSRGGYQATIFLLEWKSGIRRIRW